MSWHIGNVLKALESAVAALARLSAVLNGAPKERCESLLSNLREAAAEVRGLGEGLSSEGALPPVPAEEDEEDTPFETPPRA